MAAIKKSNRRLTPLDFEILKFIWKWKLANIMTLKYALASKRSFWKFYKILRKLYHEGYIAEIQNPQIEGSLWTLTKKGFEVVDNGQMNLAQKRYKPQSVLHDHWMSLFQLGHFVLNKPVGVELITEQELCARELVDLPKCLPAALEHIPDGFTFIKSPEGSKLVALEVEISTKINARYEEMIHFLDKTEKIDQTLWLCGTENIIEVITKRIIGVRRMRPTMHNFVLLEDFQKMGWNAPILWGDMKDRTVLELLGQPLEQKDLNTSVNSGLPDAMRILLAKERSPRSLKGLVNSVDPLKILTP